VFNGLFSCDEFGCGKKAVTGGKCARHLRMAILNSRKRPDPADDGHVIEKPRRPSTRQSRYRGQLCSEESCDRQAESKGMCKKHYMRDWQRRKREKA